MTAPGETPEARLVALTAKANVHFAINYPTYFDEEDLFVNIFKIIGGTKYTTGYVYVVGRETGKLYGLIHTSHFENISFFNRRANR